MGKHRKPWSYHKTMVIHVHDEVLAHDSQANQSNVSPVKPGASTFTVRTQNSDYKSVLKIRHTAVHAKSIHN